LIYKNSNLTDRAKGYQERTLADINLKAQIIPPEKIDFFKSEFDSQLKTYDFKAIHNLKDIVNDLVNKNLPLEFDFSTPIVENGKKVTFHLGIQPDTKNTRKNFQKFYGVETYQHNRAINI